MNQMYDLDRDKEIKLRLQEIMNKYNIKQVEVARETGIHHSSLSLWLQGKIKGHMVKISETIENYLENFMSNKPRMNTMHISKLNLLKSPNNRLDEDLDQNNGFGSLIPIKMDLEIEQKRLKENFLWDKNEPYLTLENFAKIMVEEHNLPASYENEIINSMKKQINAFRGYKPVEGELIRVIKLNVRIGNIILRDQFEWDINNPRNSPETAHQDKRMQVYYNKSNDYQYGTSTRGYGIQDSLRLGGGPQDLGDGVKTMIRSLDQLLQPAQQNVSKFFQPSPIDEPFNGWAPDVQILTESDLKKIEKQEERKARYDKRRR
ncbi:swi snf-related matrix-associated actin-dependent regulator of [Stylonychia lemnae]|uniref:Swi snf-related matrix-associated actin-dependent regulator of n=1 Tax=Stylonychia lemnae TaxID=5949 RepID=A0A078B4E1_STYLE|nr:swi snf-related matrix-associated actin-dependent regulator of [Stylonychia lemnae]|eukprot:CDW89370.1 swi snf-related matrix-associated actin-dependent regulator of [Stylonychia lemnae]